MEVSYHIPIIFSLFTKEKENFHLKALAETCNVSFKLFRRKQLAHTIYIARIVCAKLSAKNQETKNTLQSFYCVTKKR